VELDVRAVGDRAALVLGRLPHRPNPGDVLLGTALARQVADRAFVTGRRPEGVVRPRGLDRLHAAFLSSREAASAARYQRSCSAVSASNWACLRCRLSSIKPSSSGITGT